jgi:predicted PurR-regulated permease PerM
LSKGPDLSKANRLLIFLFLLFAGMYFARPFLVPVSLAILFSMLMTGLANRLEQWGLPRWLSTTVCALILVITFLGSVYFVTDEVAEFANDIPAMKKRAQENLVSLQEQIEQKLGIASEKQSSILRSRTGSIMDGVGTVLQGILQMIADVLRYFVLITVYVILMLLYRDKFHLFILKQVPDNKQEHARDVLQKCTYVAEHYLVGKALMVVAQFVLYALGYKLIGLDHALFMALIAAVLSIIPIVGTLVGGAIPVLIAFVSGSSGVAAGAIVVFLVAQIIETYVLTPLVVGGKVNLNPLFTIMAVILGGALWGAIGMIVFIPFLAIVKIICDNIQSLHALGFLIGKEQDNGKISFLKRLMSRAKRPNDMA